MGSVSGSPDPKPEKRIIDKTVKPTGDRCVVTGQTYNLHAHHLIPRGGGGGKAGGDDCLENLVWLSASLHDLFHSGSPAQRETVGMRVRDVRTEEQMVYLLNHPRGGEDFLERKYPKW